MAGGRQATGGDAASSVAAPSPTAPRRLSRGSGRRGRARAARLQGRDSLRARFSRDRGRRRGVATATRRRHGDAAAVAACWRSCRLVAAVPPHFGARGTAGHAARFAGTPRASLFPYSSRPKTK